MKKMIKKNETNSRFFAFLGFQLICLFLAPFFHCFFIYFFIFLSFAFRIFIVHCPFFIISIHFSSFSLFLSIDFLCFAAFSTKKLGKNDEHLAKSKDSEHRTEK